MEFINRKDELKKLKQYDNLSKKQLFVTAISGLRRVGKTTLVKEFIKNKKAIYFFVYESKTSHELLLEFTEELRKHKIITSLESLKNWYEFFEIIFKRCKNYTIVFDELQNFYSIDSAVFSIIQKNYDENSKTPLHIIILGSLVGLFKKIFEDNKEPLFGRVTATLNLQPFTLKYSLESLNCLNYSDIEKMLELYAIFGGFPKYYAAIEQFKLNKKSYSSIIEYLFIQDNAPLENEVQNILKQEFGRRSPVYYSILHSISIGKTKIGEIADKLQMKESSITRHLLELQEKFNLLKTQNPLGNKKNTRYSINHPLIQFWFRFVYGKFSSYSLKNTDELINDIDKFFPTYMGRRFEDVCRDFMVYMNKMKRLPLELEYLGNWWGHSREGGIRAEIEIDLIGINSKEKGILFVECKWKDNVDPVHEIERLKNKSRFVQWNNAVREEYYCIIAKSFKKNIKCDNILTFELSDFEKYMK